VDYEDKVPPCLWYICGQCGRPLGMQAVFGQVGLACGRELTYVRPPDADEHGQACHYGVALGGKPIDGKM